MGLQIEFPGGTTAPASEVYLSRAIGRAVRWRFVIAFKPEAWGNVEQALVSRVSKLLIGGPCRIKGSWQNGQRIKLGQDALVVGASRREQDADLYGGPDGRARSAVHYLEIEADGTSPDSDPDPFQPRRRVHKVKNMKALIERLDTVAKPVGALMGDLESVVFPDGDKSSIVQDGLSDWQFLFRMFDQCGLLAPRSAWLPLALVGSVDEKAGTQGHWVVTPGVKSAYSAWGTIRERTLRLDSSLQQDGVGEVTFGRVAEAVRCPVFPGAELPCVIDRRPHRVFEAGRWETWRTMDVPRFTQDGAMVWRIEDRLFEAGHSLGWETEIYAVPSEARIVGPTFPLEPNSWVGLGKVERTSTDGPWVQVRLNGFESGSDLVDVRIGTPYSGKNGRRGLHWVPEDGTEVVLTWSGRFDESIILAGNARSQAAEFSSPSTYLEAEHTAQYADVHVVKVGDTTVDSKLTLNVNQRTDVTSTQRLQVKADGADLKMSGGTVYTGRGM